MPAPSVAAITTIPASAVTFSLSGSFGSSEGSTNDLFVVRHNVLELWACDAAHGVLKMIKSSVLHAPPLQAMAFAAPGRDVHILALAFSHTHLSFLQYNRETFSYDTIAAVVLQQDTEFDVDRGGVPPLLRYDSSRHVICVFFHRKWLAVIPVGSPLAAQKENASSAEAQGPASKVDDWGDEDEADSSEPTAPSNADASAVQGQQACDEVDPTAAYQCEPLTLGEIVLVDCTLQLKRPLRQVRDVQFAPSFSEPTLAVLCEQESAWAGRVKLADYQSSSVKCKSLSCSIVWLSLSIRGGQCHPVEVGDMDGIPYSSTHLVPAPSFEHVPGGVLCFSHHSVLHVTPKRRFGCYINKFGKEEADSDSGASTNWGAVSWTHGKAADPFLLLHSACSLFLQDRALLIATVSGTILWWQLETDGRSVVGGRCTVLGNCPRPSAIARLSDTLVFIGTTEGDSPLHRIAYASDSSNVPRTAVCSEMKGIGFIADADIVDAIHDSQSSSSGTHAESQGLSGTAATENTDDDNPFVQLLSGDADTEHAQYVTRPPVAPADLVEARELALLSGSEAYGSITYVRDHLLPVVQHRNAIECVGCFVVPFAAAASATHSNKRPRPNEEVSKAPATVSADFLLLLSTRNATIVLQSKGTGSRLVQLKAEESAFATNSRTVYASAVVLNGGPCSVQVTERDVVVVAHMPPSHNPAMRVVGTFSLRATAAVWSTIVSGNILLVLYSDCKLVAFVLRHSQNGSVPLVEVPVLNDVTAAAHYAARDGSAPMLFAAIKGAAPDEKSRLDVFALSESTLSRPALLARVESFQTLPSFVKVGVDVDVSLQANGKKSAKAPTRSQNEVVIEEMRVMHLCGPRRDEPDLHPSLFLLSEGGDCTVYTVALSQKGSSLLPDRFVKKAHHFVDRDAPRASTTNKESIDEKMKKKLSAKAEQQRQNTVASRRACQRLVPFTNIRGLTGMYVCGKSPRFYFSLGSEGCITSHRHVVANGVAVRSLAPLSAEWLRDGFVCCCEGAVAFCSLPRDVDVFGAAVTRNVRVGSTPRRINFCAASQSQYVITSTVSPFRPVKAPFDVELRILLNEDGTVQSVASNPQVSFPPITAADGIPSPVGERYSVQLIPAMLSRAPNGLLSSASSKFELDENEEVLTSQLVALHVPLSSSALDGHAADTPVPSQPVLAVGTAYPIGEDVACRGRLLLFRAMTVAGRRQLVLLHEESCKGPVTALTGLNDKFLVAAVGGTVKIMSFDWASKKLVVSAFLFAGLYVSALRSVHNFLLIGDLHRSCIFARFSEDERVVDVVARHGESFSVNELGIVYNGDSIGFVVTDASRNVMVLSYAPALRSDGRVKEAKLVLEADARFPGGSVSKLLGVRRFNRETQTFTTSNKLIYCTNYGEVGSVLPLSESDNRPAQWLLRRLGVDIPHDAALTPKYFRRADYTAGAGPCTVITPKQAIVDADELRRLAMLSVVDRRAVCSAAGSQVDRSLGLVQALEDGSLLCC